MKLLYSTVTIICCFFLSCEPPADKGESSSECQHIARIESPDETQISDLVDKNSVFFINLEKTDSSLLGMISRVITFGDRVYVKDMLISKGIFIFDKNGKFICKPTIMGQGPREFITLSDFKIDPVQKRLVVLDRYAKTITFFDLDGRFLQRNKLGFTAEYFTILPDGKYVFFADSSAIKGKNSVTVTDNEFNIIGTYYSIPQNNNFILGVPTRLTTDEQGNALFSPPYDNKIYKISANSFSPVYCMDFNFGKLIPQDAALEITPFNLTATLSKGGYILPKGNFIENQDNWHTSFYYNGGASENYMLFCEKSTGKVKTVREFNKDDSFGVLFSSIRGSNHDYFISVFDPSKVKKLNLETSGLSQDFKDGFKEIEDEDNPILIFYKLKTF